jgi:hypothetical protein
VTRPSRDTDMSAWAGYRRMMHFWQTAISAGLAQLPFATVGLGKVRFLLVAQSYGGKSTLAAHLIAPNAVPQAATPVLVDDNCTSFDPWDRAVCLGRPMVLRAQTCQMLGDNMPAFRSFYRDPHETGAMAGQPQKRAAFLSRHRIDAVVFLVRRGNDVGLRPLTVTDADSWASYTLRQRLGQLPAARDLRLLGRLIRQAPLGRYELAYDRPADGVAGLVQIWRETCGDAR